MANKTVPLKIKEQRERMGWSQSDLAKNVGISPGHVGMIESGKANPSIKTLEKIAKVFKIDFAYFLEEKPGVFMDQLIDNLSAEEREFLEKENVRPWITLAKDFTSADIKPEDVREVMQLLMKLKKQENPG